MARKEYGVAMKVGSNKPVLIDHRRDLSGALLSANNERRRAEYEHNTLGYKNIVPKFYAVKTKTFNKRFK